MSRRARHWMLAGIAFGLPVVNPMIARAASPSIARSILPVAIPARIAMSDTLAKCVDSTAQAKKHKGGFGHFVGKMIKEHGVQALELATPVGEAAMMSKGMSGMAAAQGLQAVSASQRGMFAGQRGGLTGSTTGMGSQATLAQTAAMTGSASSPATLAAAQTKSGSTTTSAASSATTRPTTPACVKDSSGSAKKL